jgi:DNA-binding transcriptional LysR family regulator
LEVTTDDRAVDMVEEGYDLVIRVNPNPDAGLIGRIFLRDRLVVVARPDLARPRDGSPVRAVVRGAGGDAETWDVGASSIAVEPVLRLSSLMMVRDAVRAGVGIARLPISLVSHDLEARRLVSWGEVAGPETTLWALYPSRRLLSARVSAFLEHLKTAFPTGAPDELARYIED